MKQLFQEYGEDIFDKSIDFWKEIRADLELKNKAKLKDEKLSVNAIKKITSSNYWSSFNSMYHTGLKLLDKFGDKKWMNFLSFVDEVKQHIKEEGIEVFIKDKLQSPSTTVIKKLCLAMSERDEEAEPVIKSEKDGAITYQSDSEVKDYERVPFGTDIYKYFDKEVAPYVSDAWIDEDIKDAKDGKVGIIGYEIPLTRYFYEYKAPRALENIGADIEKVENELLELLKDL
jgi:type I restriction enzyme M protein